MKRNSSLAEVLIHGFRTNHGFENFESWKQRDENMKKLHKYVFGDEESNSKLLTFLTNGK